MKRTTRDARLARRMVPGIALVGLMLVASTARAQTLWELTPYRVNVFVAANADGRLPADFAAQVAPQIVDRLDSLVGAAWLATAEPATGSLRQRMLTSFDAVTAEDLPPAALEADKVVLVALEAGSSGVQLRSREYDVRTQTWGTPVNRHLAQARPLAREAARSVIQCFAPLAQIEKAEQKTATLRIRAAGLSPRDPALAWVAVGDFFRPILRQSDREGKVRKITAIPWTFIQVESVGAPDAQGTIYSALRSPIAARKRGRTEQIALLVRRPPGETRLEIVSRTHPDQPLSGYEVYAYGPNDKTTVLLGRSDAQGSVAVPQGPQTLRLLVVKSGGEFLARLPIVPGLEPVLTAPVPRDDERLAAEGFITGLQEELVDLVIRREVLMALVRARLTDGNLDEAQKLAEELAELRTRDQFALLLDAEKQRIAADDRVVQAKIDRLFSDTLQLVNNFMPAGPLEELQAELRQAQGAQSPDAEPASAEAPPPAAPAAAAPATAPPAAAPVDPAVGQ